MPREATVSELDYLFGWRWLLPLAENSTIRLYGFEPNETLFWVHGAAGGSVIEQGNADVLIVQGERCGETGKPTPSEMEAAAVVCVIVGWQRSRVWRVTLKGSFEAIREYGLLPAVDSRVVIPLSACSHAASALGLHRPGRSVARLGLLVARAMASVGSVILLQKHVLLIATRDRHAIPYGAVQANLFAHVASVPSDYALYLGRPDENRKTVILPLGSSVAESVLKVASTARARAAINNEANALFVLSQSSLSELVPKLNGLESFGGVLTLYQEYRPRRQMGQGRLDATVVSFLGRLASLSSKLVPLSARLACLPADASASLPSVVAAAWHSVRGRLHEIGESGGAVSVHRTHGDFAPWNCAWSDQGLFVFDWEDSREDGLALSDAFYYAIAPVLLAQRNASATRTLTAALDLAARVAKASHAKPDVRVCMALWLLERAGQAGLYDELMVQLDRSWR